MCQSNKKNKKCISLLLLTPSSTKSRGFTEHRVSHCPHQAPALMPCAPLPVSTCALGSAPPSRDKQDEDPFVPHASQGDASALIQCPCRNPSPNSSSFPLHPHEDPQQPPAPLPRLAFFFFCSPPPKKKKPSFFSGSVNPPPSFPSSPGPNASGVPSSSRGERLAEQLQPRCILINWALTAAIYYRQQPRAQRSLRRLPRVP